MNSTQCLCSTARSHLLSLNFLSLQPTAKGERLYLTWIKSHTSARIPVESGYEGIGSNLGQTSVGVIKSFTGCMSYG